MDKMIVIFVITLTSTLILFWVMIFNIEKLNEERRKNKQLEMLLNSFCTIEKNDQNDGSKASSDYEIVLN